MTLLQTLSLSDSIRARHYRRDRWTLGSSRILITKLDHIGDLLIAAPALMLLRRSFADAHITLLCAPWNVALARRLGVADEIHPLAFFSSNSTADVDRAAIDERRRAAVRKMAELRLASFDLAIDLRRDEDTRELLKLVDSVHYAGFGDLAVFSYLDVALPFARHGVAAGASRLRLGARDLDRDAQHMLDANGLHLTTSIGSLDLAVRTDQVWSPGDDGEPDWRPLGTALWRVDIASIDAGGHSAGMSELARDAMRFGPGWLDWEAWGRWSSVDDGHLRLSFPARSEQVRLAISVQGHTSPSHPRATVSVQAGDAAQEHVFSAGDGPATLVLPCRAALRAPSVHSDPLLLRGGRYRGTLTVTASSIAEWVPLSLKVKSSAMDQTLAALPLPASIERAGLLSFPFEVEIKDSADAVRIEIEAERPDDALAVGIVGIELDWMQGRLPTLPVTHMSQQLLDLAAMAALRFAPKLVADEGEVARRLRSARDGSSAAKAVDRLRKRKRGHSPFWRVSRARTMIGVGIGANKETKRWSEENFQAIVLKLLEDQDVDVVLVGGPQESVEAQDLADRLDSGDRVHNLCACCRIEDLGEVLAELDGFLGLDTGTTHFAGRVGIRTFAIFGASHDPLEWGPVGAFSGWAAADLACAGCSLSLLQQCDRQLACMTTLTPDAIWPAVRRTLLEPGTVSANLILPEMER